MEKALFQGWNDNQLRAAFMAANAEIVTLREIALDRDFWRNVAYVALLTGGLGQRG